MCVNSFIHCEWIPLARSREPPQLHFSGPYARNRTWYHVHKSALTRLCAPRQRVQPLQELSGRHNHSSTTATITTREGGGGMSISQHKTNTNLSNNKKSTSTTLSLSSSHCLLLSRWHARAGARVLVKMRGGGWRSFVTCLSDATSICFDHSHWGGWARTHLLASGLARSWVSFGVRAPKEGPAG